LRKLGKQGFGGSFLPWIGSYLTGREQFVKASFIYLFINDVFYVSTQFTFFCKLMISKYFILLPATVTLQMRRLNLMFFPVVHRQRDAAQLGEV
jgi:hypothetical protein